MVAQTSKEAFAKIQNKLGDKQAKVYEAIKELGAATNEEIARYLNWPINRVTGRVTELVRYGLVDIEGLGKNASGFTAKKWSVRDLNDRHLREMANDCAD